jgi:hypothetical protein
MTTLPPPPTKKGNCYQMYLVLFALLLCKGFAEDAVSIGAVEVSVNGVVGDLPSLIEELEPETLTTTMIDESDSSDSDHLEEVEIAFINMSKELEETKVALQAQTSVNTELAQKINVIQSANLQLQHEFSEANKAIDICSKDLSTTKVDLESVKKSFGEDNEALFSCRENESFLHQSLEELLQRYDRQQIEFSHIQAALENAKTDLSLISQTVRDMDKPKDFHQISHDFRIFSAHQYYLFETEVKMKSKEWRKRLCIHCISLSKDLSAHSRKLFNELYEKFHGKFVPFVTGVVLPKMRSLHQTLHKQSLDGLQHSALLAQQSSSVIVTEWNSLLAATRSGLLSFYDNNVRPVYDTKVQPLVDEHWTPFYLNNIKAHHIHYKALTLRAYESVKEKTFSWKEVVTAEINGYHPAIVKWVVGLKLKGEVQSHKLLRLLLKSHQVFVIASVKQIGPFAERAVNWTILCASLVLAVLFAKFVAGALLITVRFVALALYWTCLTLPLAIISSPLKLYRAVFKRQ